MNIAAHRLHSQLLAKNGLATPHAVVSHMLAVQAQDYLGALWAVGVRMRAAVEADVEAALSVGSIVRCWPMRGTLHFVAAEDVRWLLDLLAPRVLARYRPRLEREFLLDAKTLKKCATLTGNALRGGHALTRPELYALFEKAKIATGSSRGLHILFSLAHERLICFGPRRGKQPAFVLLDEWVPPSKPRPREEALAEVARRYLIGHGPATAADLAWWAGLTTTEAKEALALAGPQKSRAARMPNVRLLPPFDEYTVAYKDRAAIVDPAFAKKVNAGGGMLNAVVVIDGRVAGSWKRTLRGDTADVAVTPFRPLTDAESRAVDVEVARYTAFLRMTPALAERR